MPMVSAAITTDSSEWLAKEKGRLRQPFFVLERVKGIEPSYAAWEAAVLPLNYTRNASRL